MSQSATQFRQWCDPELIRAYGVRIDCIEIERLVKVARERRPHRIDVVVLRDGSPYVVVECKSRRIKSLDAAMKQARSYGDMPDVSATYAVATNGDHPSAHPGRVAAGSGIGEEGSLMKHVSLPAHRGRHYAAATPLFLPLPHKACDRRNEIRLNAAVLKA